MKPGPMPLELYRGDSAAWQFKLFDDEGKTIPTNLTGVQAKAQIRDRSGGDKITDLACTITPPNVIDVRLSAEDSRTLEFTRGFWDLQLTYTDGRVHTIVAGGVTVTADITDSDSALVLQMPHASVMP
jgi:hypothetical protein